MHNLISLFIYIFIFIKPKCSDQNGFKSLGTILSIVSKLLTNILDSKYQNQLLESPYGANTSKNVMKQPASRVSLICGHIVAVIGFYIITDCY